LPDNAQAQDGIGDTAKHHVYFYSSGVLQDDATALRAATEYQNALNCLKLGDSARAAKYAGIMTHYIADVGVFGHVMGSETDWGKETHHSDYEDHVNAKTATYDSEFDSYLSFDGTLNAVSAYDATKNLAYDTTFDIDGGLSAVWMDQNYDWNDPTFKNRAGESLNLAVNYIADVLYTLYTQEQQSQSTMGKIVINEVEQNPPGTDTGHEWIELYNPTPNVVDIGGWTISTTAGATVKLTISLGTNIAAGGYYVVTYDKQWLDNEGEYVILRDSGGNEVDRTPSLSDTYDDGRSWQRYPNGIDTDSVSDWSFRTNTKGLSNGGTIAKSPSSISTSVFPSSITIGSSITISGSIAPAHSSVTVTLSFSKPDGTALIWTPVTASNGSYSYAFTPDMVGSWNMRASWEGDAEHEGASSSWMSFTVSKISSTISCNLSSSRLTIGGSVTVSGSISPSHSGVNVTISYNDHGAWNTLATATSAPDGSYSYLWTPSPIGSYQLKASWEGDESHSGATSSVVSITVVKILTAISCTSSSSEIIEGNTVIISGSISPTVSGKAIILTYRKPDGTIITRTVTTISDGSYNDSYKPDAAGSWSVTASWNGDSTHDNATSSSISFTVKSGCLIATATYGSELSPEVQFLREFRDNTVLTTFAGSSFMVVFNGFYYSFSPDIASAISRNKALRGAMKVILYPLIGILHLSFTAFSLFSFNPELGVLIAGLIASSLISVIYVTPWVLLFSLLRKLRPSIRIIRLTGLFWAGSVMAVALAEVAMSSLLMMISTGAFVIVTMCLTILATVRVIMKRMNAS